MKKWRYASWGLLLLFGAGITTCDLLGDSGGFADPFGPTGDRPGIPIPDHYQDEVPRFSEVLVIDQERGPFFRPFLFGALDQEGNPLALLYDPQDPSRYDTRVTLVDAEGAPVVDPVVKQWNFHEDPNTFESVPLEEHEMPVLQFVRYWQRVGAVQSYAGGSATTLTETIVRGNSQTRTQEFTESISVEASVSKGGLFAKTTVTASSSYSETQSFSSTESSENSYSSSFTVSPKSGTNLVYSVWQLVEEFRFVGTDGALYTHPHYTFSPDSLRFVFPTDEIVPVAAYYTN